jgi:hypothetical protein
MMIDQTYRCGEPLFRRAVSVGGWLALTERHDLDRHDRSPGGGADAAGNALLL